MSTPDHERPLLSVVVMAFNELRSLGSTVQELESELRRLAITYEIVIVDDGSTDGTSAEADRLASALPTVRVIHHGQNRGLGGVYRTGFGEGRGEWLTFFPADGQFPATLLGTYLSRREQVDLILGYLPTRDRPISGRFFSWAERCLLTLLFGAFPRFQGILMFRRHLLTLYPLVTEGRGWTVLMEFILRASRGGARHISIPISLRPRTQGASKVTNLRTIASNLRQVIALRARM